jgi:hypothetical protein
VSQITILLLRIDFMPSLFISSHFALISFYSATVMIAIVRPMLIAAQEAASHLQGANGESAFLVPESQMGHRDAVQMKTAAGPPWVSHAQMVYAASPVNPVAAPRTRIAAAGTRTRATFVSSWAAPALDHAVFLHQHHEQLSAWKAWNCEYKIEN